MGFHPCTGQSFINLINLLLRHTALNTASDWKCKSETKVERENGVERGGGD